MGGADFHIAMTDMIKAGFPVASTGQTFPGLREDQIAFGLPAAVSAGNGYTAPAAVHQALDCLVKGQNCGGYSLRGGASPAFRGLMTWSINWDRYKLGVQEQPRAVPRRVALRFPAGAYCGKPQRKCVEITLPGSWSRAGMKEA